MNRNINIRDYQRVLSEMLDEVDRICTKHSIDYMLFAGSALGAVRHQGFIPWDDDLDIIMTRENYDKFLNIAEKEIDSDKFFLQKEFSEHWPMFYSKIRKNNTACMERYYPKDEKTHQGIFLDIFACDNLSDKKMIRKLQFYASKIVIAKSLYKRGYLTDSRKKKLFIQLCRFVPTKFCVDFCKNKKHTNSKCVHSFFAAGSKYEKNIFPREWFTNVEYISFEENMRPVSAYYKCLLTQLYGDYMKLPKEEERLCKVHGEIVDLEKSYECYLDEQKSRRYEVYSRSIR